MEETLFEKYGGLETFTKVVKNFYQKVLDSEQIEHYFRGVDMGRLITHQSNFISRMLGGPDGYEKLDIKKAHANLNITAPDFNEVVELLEESLEEAGVDAEDIVIILKAVSALKNQIVTA